MIVKNKVEEGVDLGSIIKEYMLPNLVLLGGILLLFMLCKWTTSLANSTWVICQ